MAVTPRDRARAETMREIVRIGREHLATAGPTALSLRAVARDLGVVSSAVYRYVRNRDELLTLLVIDAYDSLGDAVDAAIAEVRGTGRDEFFAFGQEVREWALREPASYALLFGTPVPGYDAPSERTTQPGTRVVVALMSIIERAHGRATAGSSSDDEADPQMPFDLENAPTSLSEDARRIRSEFALTMSAVWLIRGVLVWSELFGAVSFEVFGQYGRDTFTDTGALFELHLARFTDLLGL
ncbi:MAG: TetR/AcrR family transcriptional regulator [Tomitella sp.]|nr:TetR/AcrR family transcriptional regulator [Tomitella sp.]